MKHKTKDEVKLELTGAPTVTVDEPTQEELIVETDRPMITIYQKNPNEWYSMTDPKIDEQDGDSEIRAILKLVCGQRFAILSTDEQQETCWKTLYAMAWQESTFNKYPTGDQGRSIGWFHIQVRTHKITRECAENLGCSATWTLNHLIANGYPDRYAYSIQSHNGWGTESAKNLEYASAIQGKIKLIK